MSDLPQTSTLTKILEIDAGFFDPLEKFPWTIDLLIKLHDYDPETFDHSLRVAFIISQILSDQETIVAGLVHDVGKTSLPAGILDKPEITAGEKETIQAHLRAGFNVLKKFDINVAKIMVAHHEWQENPYPRKSSRFVEATLQRQQQVLALADSVDALLSNRSYKPAWSKERVIDYLSSKFPSDDVTKAVGASLQLSAI